MVQSYPGSDNDTVTAIVDEHMGRVKYSRPGEDDIVKKLSDIQLKLPKKTELNRPLAMSFMITLGRIYVDIVSGEPLFASPTNINPVAGQVFTLPWLLTILSRSKISNCS